MAIRYLTSGESHGKALIGILEGIPSGLPVSSGDIDRDLRRRQGGHGRGGRMKIEADRAQILSGIRFGKTIGSPIALLIENNDWQNWQDIMSAELKLKGSDSKTVASPRPGHADLAGAVKYDTHDMRNILERSSARETAMRVALGAIAKRFLSEFGIRIGSYVVGIGRVQSSSPIGRDKVKSSENELLELFKIAEISPVRCPDKISSKKMVQLIDKALKEGNSLGGIFEVFAAGVPVGLGSHIQWDRRLDGKLAQALMSIQAIKGVEIGMGFEMSRKSGSEVMDEIFYRNSKFKIQNSKFYHKTNNAGGIEGGMTNGMPIIIRAAMKPIPTLRKPLHSVDINTKKPVKAAYERSDICAVPAAGVVGEAMTALVIAGAFLEKFGGDSMVEVKRNYNSYLNYLSKF
ncbi:MAG: chorismate synthase [Nitrospirae bacterium GWF2_44_13]|nr:MAG: chorismate synthase [Nitrospirae bacterium GWF2_44_13]OGW33717.1 MAG: chorismate synthase [Nitrospirae bacterium GWD2_44_7]HBG93394.1 chorismate synthase [Nitrospiraceae bacterium]